MAKDKAPEEATEEEKRVPGLSEITRAGMTGQSIQGVAGEGKKRAKELEDEAAKDWEHNEAGELRRKLDLKRAQHKN